MEWFKQCLKAIGQIEGISSVAFPHGIGCGRAGGIWDKYEGVLHEFAESNPFLNVKIYKLPPRRFQHGHVVEVPGGIRHMIDCEIPPSEYYVDSRKT